MSIMSGSFSIDIDGDCKGRRRRNLKASWDKNVSLTLICLVLYIAVISDGICAEISGHMRPKSAQRKLIINGDPVNPSDHQYFVRSAFDKIVQTDDMLCGASLIHSDIIITAAHCHGGFNYGAILYDPNTRDLDQYIPVDLQIAYPGYYEDVNVMNLDIMILRLSSPAVGAEPITLNSDPEFPIKKQNEDDAEPYILEGLGVGLTETGFVSYGLEAGYFNAMPNPQCANRLGRVNVELTNDVFCADPVTDDSICAGDSGGPLAARIGVTNDNTAVTRSPYGNGRASKSILVGVTSFGNDCEVDSVPDGFARISYYYKWINEQICKYSRDPPADCSDYFESEEYLEFAASQDPEIVWPDKVRMTMKFQHDFFAEQTVFVFRNTASNEIAYVGPQYVPKRGEYVVSDFLLPAPGNYAIEIYDMIGDGMRNPDYASPEFPKGNWTVSAEYSNGARLENLASGDYRFGTLQTKYIMLPRRMPTLDGVTSKAVDGATPTISSTPTKSFETPPVDMESQPSSSSLPLLDNTWGIMALAFGWAAFLLLK